MLTCSAVTKSPGSNINKLLLNLERGTVKQIPQRIGLSSRNISMRRIRTAMATSNGLRLHESISSWILFDHDVPSRVTYGAASAAIILRSTIIIIFEQDKTNKKTTSLFFHFRFILVHLHPFFSLTACNVWPEMLFNIDHK